MAEPTRAPGSTRSSLDNLVLTLLDDDAASLRYTAAKRLVALQQAYDELVEGTRFQVSSLTLGTVTADQELYPIPQSSYDVLQVWRVDADGTQWPLEHLSLEEMDRDHPGWQTQDAATPVYWYLWGGRHIGLWPKPADTGGTLYARAGTLYTAFSQSADTLDTPRLYDYPIACRAVQLLRLGDPHNAQAAAVTPALAAEFQQAKRRLWVLTMRQDARR